MPWRVIAHGEHVWHVDALAERRPRRRLAAGAGIPARDARSPQRFIAPFPLEATSKSALFIQAERIPDRQLVDVLVERLA
jgi:hypothetical protein